MDIKKIIISLIRILLGCTFVSSAVMKLFSLESFVLYVYSFGLFSYVTTTILARLLIILEFMLGIGLIFKIYYKYTWWGTLGMLVFFSLFLLYVALFRNDENCHCFGDFIELDAFPSIFKNVIMIGLLPLIRKQTELEGKKKIFILTLSGASILFLAFIAFPPNALYNKMYVNDDERFSQVAFDKYIQVPELSNFLDTTQNEIVGFVSATCKHCRAGNTIMQAIFEQNDLDKNCFKNYIASPNDSLLSVFKDTTNTQEYPYRTAPMFVLIEMNYGYFPTYVFFEKGKPVKAINYKEINENEIVEFLSE
ncbi:MAG: DoxX family membrane protein [Bacteroidales bacterium]|nr:DoxX family membrane protein [Bacteroidales bacterium]